MEEALIGLKSGRLTITEDLGIIHNQHTVRCRCDCGNPRDVILYQFRTNHVKSCGCLAIEHKKNFAIISPQKTHGYTHHELYPTWRHMISRCYNKQNNAYKDYGGRGIKVCDEWMKDFMNFYNWAKSNGYQKWLTIDRIENDGDYTPANCRWATEEVQANNRRSTHYVILDANRISMACACKQLNLKYKIINQRVKRDGLSFEEAILIQ